MVDVVAIFFAPAPQGFDRPGQDGLGCPRSADLDAIENLANLLHKGRIRRDRAGTMSRDRVGFRERIELDHGVAPRILGEKAMRPVRAVREKIPVSLVENEINAPLAHRDAKLSMTWSG